MKKPAKKQKPVFTVVHTEMYNVSVIVSIGQSDQEFAKSIDTVNLNQKQKLNLVDILAKTKSVTNGLTTWNDEAGFVAMRLFEWNNTPFNHSVIAHEVFHVVHRVMEFKGMSLCDESEEAYAYLTSFITIQIYKELLK